MSERVLKVLNDEVERLTKQNDTLTRDINFYFNRIDTYQRARDDNRNIIRELRDEISRHPFSKAFVDTVIADTASVIQPNPLDEFLAPNKIRMAKAQQSVTLMEDGGAMGSHNIQTEEDIPF